MYIRTVKGGYRCEVERHGVRDSATRETKAAAREWGIAREAEILAVKRGGFPNKTLRDAIERYRDEISPTKRGGHWEVKRLDAFLRGFAKIANLPLVDVDTSHLNSWRDKRLASVTKGSVQRDVNLLSHVFTIARTEWKWCGESPFVGFRAPGDNPARKRIVGMHEVRRIVRWLHHKTGEAPRTKQAQAALAYLIALRTAMRAGEVLQLGQQGVVDVAKRQAVVSHKTEHITHEKRVVPLTRKALRLIALIPPGGFTISSDSLDATFRKATSSLLIEGLTFHDSRANALTRFSRKVPVEMLAKISGHRDLKILLSTYYRITSAEIAARLD